MVDVGESNPGLKLGISVICCMTKALRFVTIPCSLTTFDPDAVSALVSFYIGLKQFSKGVVW